MNKIISLYGLPACGKSTQAELVNKKYGLYHFGMGDKIRAEIRAGTELGKKIESIHNSGILVPDELMIEIIKDCGQQAKETGMVFDGFPRIFSQAKMLDEVLAKEGLALDKFFFLRVSREKAISRINLRAELTGGRADDTDLDAIKNRFSVFKEQSSELIEYYRQQNKLVEIDGEQSIEEVFAEIRSHLE